jgi:flavin-dependent dehydrogenase
MAGAPARSAIVLGAGPAGLLATRALEGAGVRVTLVLGHVAGRPSPAQKPAHHHVHVLPASTRHVLRGMLETEAGALDTLSGQGHPDRSDLDRVLEAACRTRAEREVPGRAREVAWDRAGRVRVSTTCGARLHGDLLVDATGTARASFAGASAHPGRDIPMDVAPGSSRYTSVVLEGAGAPEAGNLSVAREAGWGVLLLGMGGGRVRATLQAPASSAPQDLPAFRHALERFGPPEAERLLAGATPRGPLHRWGPHPVTRVVLEACGEMPEGWIPVGDALLVTPPHLAGGVRHAAEHVGVVARGIEGGASLGEIRHTLAARARMSWLEGALAEALSPPPGAAPATPPAGPSPPEP